MYEARREFRNFFCHKEPDRISVAGFAVWWENFENEVTVLEELRENSRKLLMLVVVVWLLSI